MNGKKIIGIGNDMFFNGMWSFILYIRNFLVNNLSRLMDKIDKEILFMEFEDDWVGELELWIVLYTRRIVFTFIIKTIYFVDESAFLIIILLFILFRGRMYNTLRSFGFYKYYKVFLIFIRNPIVFSLRFIAELFDKVLFISFFYKRVFFFMIPFFHDFMRDKVVKNIFVNFKTLFLKEKDALDLLFGFVYHVYFIKTMRRISRRVSNFCIWAVYYYLPNYIIWVSMPWIIVHSFLKVMCKLFWLPIGLFIYFVKIKIDSIRGERWAQWCINKNHFMLYWFIETHHRNIRYYSVMAIFTIIYIYIAFVIIQMPYLITEEVPEEVYKLTTVTECQRHFRYQVYAYFIFMFVVFTGHWALKFSEKSFNGASTVPYPSFDEYSKANQYNSEKYGKFEMDDDSNMASDRYVFSNIFTYVTIILMLIAAFERSFSTRLIKFEYELLNRYKPMRFPKVSVRLFFYVRSFFGQFDSIVKYFKDPVYRRRMQGYIENMPKRSRHSATFKSMPIEIIWPNYTGRYTREFKLSSKYIWRLFDEDNISISKEEQYPNKKTRKRLHRLANHIHKGWKLERSKHFWDNKRQTFTFDTVPHYGTDVRLFNRLVEFIIGIP